MTDPRRWRDAPDEAPEGVVDLLDTASAPSSLPAGVRRRGLARVSRLAALPAAATAAWWIGMKTAAAALTTGAVVTAAVVVVQQVTEPEPEQPPSAATEETPPSGLARTPPAARVNAPELMPQPEPPDGAPPESPRPQQAGARPAPAASMPAPPPPKLAPGSPASTTAVADFGRQASDGLERETQLLEQARSALASSPSDALAITQQHTGRFPAGRLGAERTMIEIEALQRLGRHAEARAKAERLLERSPNGLYTERVRRLLGETDR